MVGSMPVGKVSFQNARCIDRLRKEISLSERNDLFFVDQSVRES